MDSISSGQPTGSGGTGEPGASKNGFGSESGSKNPLAFSVFQKLLGDKKTRDGQPPKRRGPKPDSKPALTRRQELNRQAQRTHRQRKEMYINTLETEVLRLTQRASDLETERDHAVAEVRKLKEILAINGIPYDGATPSAFGQTTSSSFGDNSSAIMSAARTNSTTNTSPPPATLSGSYQAPGSSPPDRLHAMSMQRPQQQIDYDQVGLDFVLTLERPCMEHITFLMVRAREESECHGHALMLSCPPAEYIEERPAEPYEPRVNPSNISLQLRRLHDLSSSLPVTDGQVPPVVAWNIITQHPGFSVMTVGDFEMVKQELFPKVRCYGFGAILEEFEVRDALENVFVKKSPLPFYA